MENEDHGFVLCRAPHRDPAWASAHCECGKTHEAQGVTLPERIFTVGGSNGRFFSQPSTFAVVEYALVSTNSLNS